MPPGSGHGSSITSGPPCTECRPLNPERAHTSRRVLVFGPRRPFPDPSGPIRPGVLPCEAPCPLSSYPAARAVLEEHTRRICARISGTADPDATEHTPISDDFVLALRAEAPGGTLSVEAALPLVTVAASLGELELLDRESEVSLAD